LGPPAFTGRTRACRGDAAPRLPGAPGAGDGRLSWPGRPAQQKSRRGEPAGL